MANIKNKNTQPEVLVRKYLFKQGFRYKINDVKLPGKPDIVLPTYKIVVFVHGCFWHGHLNCKKSALPTSNIEFWKNKIGGNIARDKKQISELKKLGWKVLVVWECKVKNKRDFERTMEQLIKKIK